MTADPEVPIPPVQYGGIERIVELLARGLVARGHEVAVFAHPESSAGSHLVPWRGRSSRSAADTIRNTVTLMRHAFAMHFDIIHSFSRLAYLTPLMPLSIPKLMTYQREITPRTVRWANALSRGTLWFAAISHGQMKPVARLGTWRVVFNGVRLDLYEFRQDPGPDAPLVFLGRVEKVKGPHIAIEVAQRAGLPLVLAGNVPPEHRGWFESAIAPHIGRSGVSYIGPVDDAQKNALLGRARALLMPVLWDEPFGIVMPEAMACGTPVIGLSRGAVPEVVAHEETGFVCDNVDQMVSAVGRLNEIERAACRARTEQFFSDRTVVATYEAIYREMLAAADSRRISLAS